MRRIFTPLAPFWRSMRRSIPMALVGGIALLAAMVAASLFFAREASRDANEALAAVRLHARSVQVFGALQDAETGQRGYLLTGDESYLEPYLRARSAAESGFLSLEDQLDDIGMAHARIAELDGLVRDKLAELDSTVELYKRGNAQAALAVVETRRGKELMDRIRLVMSDIERLGTGNAKARVATLDTITSWLTAFIAVSAGLLAIIVGAVLHRLVSHAVALEGAQEALSRINETLEEKVAVRTEHLQRVNAEVQSYAYIVGHDLRAPLVNIMGFTEELDRSARIFREWLERQPGRDDGDARAARLAVEEEIPEALGFIRSSTRRMDLLINQILVLARAGTRSLHAEYVSVGSLVRESLDSLRHQMQERGIEAEISGALPPVVTDRLALQQILGNLLENAVKYTDSSRKGRIAIRGWLDGLAVHLEIRDNGRGIAEKDLERIFELFRRSGLQDQPGDGVGLAHVRALARRLGGDVKVQSTLGEGTVFTVTLAADLGREQKEDAK
ncbi:MAG: CHASE3 domain-containing protein [Rhizobiales bacterium]|nr:CHASE3 domain-containing protein [Hyphomicrobiales bacterium]